jgi:hypothetical protein
MPRTVPSVAVRAAAQNQNSKFVLKHPPDSVLAYVRRLRVTNNKPVTVTASIGGTGTWLGRCGEQ